MIKVVAFDLFGTVFKLSVVPREEVKDYARQLRRLEWAPLKLPESWEELVPFDDAQDALLRLSKRYWVVTMSNAPWRLQRKLVVHNGLPFDAMMLR